MSAAGMAELNKMLEEVVDETDLETVRCATFQANVQAELAAKRRELEQGRQQVALADSALQAKRLEAEAFRHQLDGLNRELQQRKASCANATKELEVTATGLRADAEAATAVLNTATSCQGSTVLLQCGVPRRRGNASHADNAGDAGERWLSAPHHPDIQKVAAALSSPAARDALQHALRSLVPSGRLSHSLNFTHHHRHRHHHHRHHKKRRSGGAASLLEQRCVTETRVDCKATSAALVLMMAEVDDKRHDAQETLERTREQCEGANVNLGRQLSRTSRQLQGAEAAAGRLLAQLSVARGLVTAGSQTLDDLVKSLKNVRQECEQNINQLQGRERHLRHARSEVSQASLADARDCHVSQWEAASACNATCGGGVQKFRRSVVEPAGPLGMACPALETQRACNMQPCAKDCLVSVWSSWSECTAACGGGTMVRSRHVERMPQNGGEDCPAENTVVQQCNAGSCNEDCQLGPWSAWSPCSRPGGGFRHRSREVKAQLASSSQCPPEDQRFEYEACVQGNHSQQGKGASPSLLRCDLDRTAPLDLVVVVDGSRSVSDEGFEASMGFLQSLVDSLEVGQETESGTAANSRVAFILSGGPASWSAYQHCMGTPSVHSLESCNVHLRLGLSANRGAVADVLSSLAPVGGQGNLASALAMAHSVLAQQGRRGAQPVVLLLAQGRPLSVWRAADEAAALRQRARVMWLVADGDDGQPGADADLVPPPRLVLAGASAPARDNVFSVASFSDLGAPVVAQLVEAICPSADSAVDVA